MRLTDVWKRHQGPDDSRDDGQQNDRPGRPPPRPARPLLQHASVVIAILVSGARQHITWDVRVRIRKRWEGGWSGVQENSTSQCLMTRLPDCSKSRPIKKFLIVDCVVLASTGFSPELIEKTLLYCFSTLHLPMMMK